MSKRNEGRYKMEINSEETQAAVERQELKMEEAVAEVVG
jgi:hypothetical protein